MIDGLHYGCSLLLKVHNMTRNTAHHTEWNTVWKLPLLKVYGPREFKISLRNWSQNVKLLKDTFCCQGLWTMSNLSYTHTHLFHSPFSGTTQVSQYHKGKTNLDFTEARDSEWQWYQLSHMQVCISLQTDNHASTPLLSFLQTRCPSGRPTNSIKAPKA